MIRPVEIIESYKLFRNQWKSPEEIKRIQNQKLRNLVKHSYKKVPYYRELFDSISLKPKDIQSIEDLQKLPILTKKIIKSIPLRQIIARGVDINKCFQIKTSGSTALPLHIYYNWKDERIIGMALVRCLLTYGVKPWYKIGELSGIKDPPQKRKIFDYWGIWRKWELSAWQEPENWIKILLKWKPQVLIGFSMTLKLLAEAILEKRIKGVTPKIVISGAGVLDEKTRNFIGSVLTAKVFDIYGAWEGGNIAWECPQCSGYHINSDMLILEVLRDGKSVPPGQEGEVVITNLHSYAMPFIRYRLEDFVALNENKPLCGRPFPLLKHIKGRLTDIIALPSGRKIPPHPFGNVLDDIPGVGQWRVTQEAKDLLTIEIVPLWNFSKEKVLEIENKIRNIVGNEIKITILLVHNINIGPSYKIIRVSSKISNNKMDFNNLSN